jgi:tetratricopeptide (TPR) repeat protein
MVYQYEPINDEYRFQEFLKDLFDSKYQTVSFEEYGSKGNSQFGVDVYSATLRVAIQAKKKDNLKRSAKKLKTELLAELKDTLSAINGFQHPIEKLYFATTTPKFIELQNECLALTQSLKKDVIFFSWDDIQKEIAKYPAVRKKYYPHLATSTLPKELVSIPHINITEVVGRHADILKVEDAMRSSQVISIQSIGGVGKSTFAKLFYQRKISEYDFLIWLDYLSDYKKDLAYNESLIDNLQIEIRESDSEERRYEKIVNKIISLPGKVLIVIDNLQHESINSVETEIKKFLSKEQLSIIVTSRQPFESYTTLLLNPVEETFAKAIFYNNCPKKIDDDGIEELIHMVDSNALLLELIAKTIYQDIGLSVRKVIDILKEGKVEESCKVEIEHVLKSDVLCAPLYTHLSKIVDLNNVERVSYEFYVVLLMSILPASLIKIENIFSVFLYRESQPYKVTNAINSLHKRGIITRVGDEIKMHQMVQDVIRMQVTSFVLLIDILISISHSIRKANNSFSDNGYRIAVYAESILSKLNGDKAVGIRQPLILIKNNLYLMYRYLGERHKADKLAKEIIDEPNLEDFLQSQQPRFRHTINHNIATYYFDIGNLKSAEQYFKTAIDSNGQELNIDLINSYSGLFEIYYQQKKLKESLECIGLGLEYLKQFPNDHDDMFANLLNTSAIVNSDLGKNNEASFLVTQAIKTYREYNGEKKNDGMLAIIYSNAALVFLRINNYEVAIQFVLHAIKYQSKLNLENDEKLLGYYNQAIAIYDQAGQSDHANQLRNIVQKSHL